MVYALSMRASTLVDLLFSCSGGDSKKVVRDWCVEGSFSIPPQVSRLAPVDIKEFSALSRYS
jgi:hypothetical protein